MAGAQALLNDTLNGSQLRVRVRAFAESIFGLRDTVCIALVAASDRFSSTAKKYEFQAHLSSGQWRAVCMQGTATVPAIETVNSVLFWSLGAPTQASTPAS